MSIATRIFVFIFIFEFGFCSISMNAQESRFQPASQGQLITSPSYAVDFNISSRIPHWVAYELTAAEATGPANRSNDFRNDARATNCAPSSWAGSGYDRGHMKPAGDSKNSDAEMSSSFLMSNIAPQTASLNRGKWKSLEASVRAWSIDYSRVYVIMGPSAGTIGYIAGDVRVPSHYWKTALRYSSDTAAVAFIFPNANSIAGVVSDYRVSVDSLEAFTGINFYSQLPNELESRIEKEKNSVWQTKNGSGSGGTATQCKGMASTTGAQCRNLTNYANHFCYLHQSQSSNPQPTGLNQCRGTAKSTGKRCRIQTKDPSGYCHHHRH